MDISVLEPIRNPPTLTPFLSRSKDQRYISLLLRQYPFLKLCQLKQIQAQLTHKCLHQDNILIAKLISICSSTGTMDYATRLFYSIKEPDLILCNSMLKGYTQNNLFEQAFGFYFEMICKGFSQDHYTLPYVLKACAGLLDRKFGRQIHAGVVKSEQLLVDNVFVMNSLVDMYCKCCQNDFATRVFQEIAKPDSTSWNIMILGLVNSGDLGSARKLFSEMPEGDTVSWNTLISAYAKAGELEYAWKLFSDMPERNLVSWNALIAGFSQNDRKDEALSLFAQMLKSGIRPDNTTMVTIISAVGGARLLGCGTVDQVVSFTKSANSVSVSSAILNLYAKNGRIEDARKVFNEIPEKDLVTWNAMIAGYAQNQMPAEAIELFQQMQSESRSSLKPDGVTMVSLIAACSLMGALSMGEWVHAYIEKNRIELDVFLLTALVDMYAKCGDLDHARCLFWGMVERDLASWNAMINGLAIHGQANEALEIFTLMEKDGMMPTAITFVGLLSACNHGGLVAKGLELFDLMQNKYGTTPLIEHYGCVVDLLGRAGQLTEAYEFIKLMPIKPDTVVWRALLGACRCHQNIELAEKAARQLVELEPHRDGNYVLLSNVYASAGRWEDVERLRSQMKASGVQKKPGCSAVELAGSIHEFTAGDRSHPMSEEIYAVWDELVDRLKPMGYEPDSRSLQKNLNEEDMEEALYRHSEKLALSFGLITSGAASPIRIVKNLRICADCHRTMELVSKLEEREIIVRDRYRFHHFTAGQCSCGGYW